MLQSSLELPCYFLSAFQTIFPSQISYKIISYSQSPCLLRVVVWHDNINEMKNISAFI